MHIAIKHLVYSLNHPFFFIYFSLFCCFFVTLQLKSGNSYNHIHIYFFLLICNYGQNTFLYSVKVTVCW